MLTCKPSRARSVIFDLLRDRQKRRRSDALADGIIAAHCGRAEIRRFRLKGSSHQTYTIFRFKGSKKRESPL
jgi:hypothetical protein